MGTMSGHREFLRECARTLRILLLQRNISREELARQTGLKPETLSKISAGWQAGRRCVAAIEDVLGVPVWTIPTEFSKRRQLSKALGLNPLFANKPALLKVLRDSGIPGRSKARNRRDMMALLERHFLPSEKRRRKTSAQCRADKQRRIR